MQPQLSDCKVKFANLLEIYAVLHQETGTPRKFLHLLFQVLEITEEIKIILIRHVFLSQIVGTIQVSGKITLEDYQPSFLTRIFLAKIVRSLTPLRIKPQTVSISNHAAQIIFISSSDNLQITSIIVSTEFLFKISSANAIRFFITQFPFCHHQMHQESKR